MKKILVYALLLVMPAGAFAAGQKEGKQAGPVSEYVKQHIMPVVQEKRTAFDALLSETEKNELAVCREELQQLRQSRKAAREAEQGAGDAFNHEAWKESRDKMKEVMQKVRFIAERHSDQLDEIFASLLPYGEQWKKDIKQLVNTDENAEGRMAAFAGTMMMHNGSHRTMWSRSRFLLLEASTNAAAQERKEGIEEAQGIPSMAVFPNPAAGQFALTLSNIPLQNKVTITDVSGKVVLEKINMTSAEPVDCSGLNNGIYFVNLTTDDNSINQKLIVSH